MNWFICENCIFVVYFDNVFCFNCGFLFGFEKQVFIMWVYSEMLLEGYVICVNVGVCGCNWFVLVFEGLSFCFVCLFNQMVLDFFNFVYVDCWIKFEVVKWYFFYGIFKFGLLIVI